MTRKCQSPDCAKLVRPGRFMCFNHWSIVAKPLQRTINASYRTHQNVRELLSDLAYVEACATAIEAQQTHTPLQPNSYRRIATMLKKEATK